MNRTDTNENTNQAVYGDPPAETVNGHRRQTTNHFVCLLAPLVLGHKYTSEQQAA